MNNRHYIGDEWPGHDIELLDCPRCGRTPQLQESWDGRPRRPLIGYRYVCRRWFGLRSCFDGDRDVKWNEKDWGDLARRRAAKAWNQAVAAIKLGLRSLT